MSWLPSAMLVFLSTPDLEAGEDPVSVSEEATDTAPPEVAEEGPSLNEAPPVGPSVVAPGPSPSGPPSADPPIAASPPVVLAESRVPEPFRLERPMVIDYNAADPNRSWANVGRALASVGVANVLVWQYNWLVGEEWAYVTGEEIAANFRGGFEFDGNRLPTNFLSHPYQGSAYFNVARASGLSFWESAPFTFLGSLSWELTGESEAPSTNDLLATTMGGIVLGEILYRISSDMLDDSSVGFERFLREFLALVVNPGRGIERLADGKAFSLGPPPARRHLRHLALDLGVDRILLVQDRELERYDARALVALQLEYGDLLPTEPGQVLGPFSAFDFYGALNLGSIDELGAQVYAQGLLVGFSSDIGADEDEVRDNNVFGLVQSFDFRGAHVAQFGGMGIGPTNIVVLRFGKNRRLRIGSDVQWLVIGGSSSPADGESRRGYNYLTGLTAGEELRLETSKYGEFGFRAKQYAGVVIDGEPGEEFIGHTRFWYEIDVASGVGVGVSPSVVHRVSRYDNLGELTLAQVETQFYARGHF
jgi:hypothetical protein